MRMFFGLIALLLALLFVAWLVHTQWGGQVDQTAPSAAGQQGGDTGKSASAALKQFKQSLDQAFKARPASVPE